MNWLGVYDWCRDEAIREVNGKRRKDSILMIALLARIAAKLAMEGIK